MSNQVELNTQDFIVVEGIDHKDFCSLISKIKRDFSEDKNQLFILGSLDNINIELFCSGSGIIHTGAEAIYEIIRREYDNALDVDF